MSKSKREKKPRNWLNNRLKQLSKKDPEFKKKIQKAEKAKDDLKSYLKSRGVPELSKAEKRALARGEYFK